MQRYLSSGGLAAEAGGTGLLATRADDPTSLNDEEEGRFEGGLGPAGGGGTGGVGVLALNIARSLSVSKSIRSWLCCREPALSTRTSCGVKALDGDTTCSDRAKGK